MLLNKKTLLFLCCCSFFAACTKDIDSGSYGPFSIGDDKLSCLKKINDAGIPYIEPVAPHETPYSNPNNEYLDALDDSQGIIVRVDNYSYPLRIEFKNSKVSRKWPEYPIVPYFVSEDQRANDEKMKNLSDSIAIGDDHQKVNAILLSFEESHHVSVAEFLPDWEKISKDVRGHSVNDPDYHAMLMKTDIWKFSGLNDFGRYHAYYSDFTFYFDKGKLVRITQFRFPFELP